MSKYAMDQIRNVVLLGHAGAGKTTLAEAILHKAGITNRQGSVDDKTSILDSDMQEKEHGHSVDSAVAHFSYKDREVNLIDAPGYPDFIGASLSTLPGAETAIIVINASAGIQMNTRRMYQAAKDRGMAVAIVVNKIDSCEDLNGLVDAIQESFGMECRPANVCTADGSKVFDCIQGEQGEGFTDVAEAHTNLIETALEADEELMEAYLGGEAMGPKQLIATMDKAMVAQVLVPILFTNAREEVGVEQLMDLIASYCPCPGEGVKHKLIMGEGEDQKEVEVDPDPEAPLLGVVIRQGADPKSHIRNTTIRLIRGTMAGDTNLHVLGQPKAMRSGHVNKLQGDKLDPIDSAGPGDIITLAKLEHINNLDTIYVGDEPGVVKVPKLPVPMYSLAIEAKSRGDEGKISAALQEVVELDPTFKVSRDRQTHEQLISGIGELHVRIVLERMKANRKLDVNTRPPQIPYLETITKSVQGVEYTHKKQSGGAGQFGRVIIDMEPNERGAGYEFVDKIFGGSIDQPFRPSVDKGCQAAMQDGVLGGFPVVDVKVSLVDGKTHPVDSKDIAFQIAGREAFRIAFMKCAPCLMEPVVSIDVTVPADNVGDITGDLSGRRGRVQGQDILPGNMATIKALVPLAELQNYNSQLKSVTGGQGSFSMELSHYEVVPPNIQQQVIQKIEAEKEAAAAG